MVKSKKRTLLILLVAFFAIFVSLGCANIAKAEEQEEEEVLRELEEEIIIQTGLGLGINVVTAQDFNDFKTGYSILDQTALEELPIAQINYNETESVAYSSTEISDIMTDFGLSMTTGAAVDIFLAKLGSSFTYGINFNYEQNTFKYFYMFYQNVYRYNQYILNYANPATYQNAYSSDYLDDLDLLADGYMSYEYFFNKYGTHLAGSAIMGGKLMATYALTSNVVAMNESNKANIDAYIDFPNVGTTVLANIATEFSGYSTLSFTYTDIKSCFYVKAEGGEAFSGGMPGNFTSAYNTWCASFSDPDESVIVDYTNNGLVPLWSILPTEYSYLASDMQAAFETIRLNYKNSFINQFKTGECSAFSGGKGSLSHPYVITTAQQLRNIETTSFTSHYALANDISLGGQEWIPIGGFYKQYKFTGTFNGQNHVISNLTRTTDITEQNDRIHFGLFGYVYGSGGTVGKVQNIIFQNVNIAMTGPAVNNANTRVFVGVVAGVVDGGEISGISCQYGTCSYDCNTNGISYVGSLVGLARDARIISCGNGVNVTSGRYSAAAGGIVGYANNTFINYCMNLGTVTARCTGWGGAAGAGGIVGAYYDNSACQNIITNSSSEDTMSISIYGIVPFFSSYIDIESAWAIVDNYS